MGKIRGVLLLLAFGMIISTGQVRADETITNCAQVTVASPDDTDSTPANADFTKDPALFEDDESCARVTKVIPYDYGDAPDPTYPTTEPSTGAKHLLGGDVYLGSCVDSDTGSTQGDATADDQNAGAYTFGTCVGTDDEDGVTFPELTVGATGLSLNVVFNPASTGSCKLNAWIDWNGDGDWDDANEILAADTPLALGNNAIAFDVPITAKAGEVYSRFRCSTAGGDTVTGEAADGEVEDYRVTVVAIPSIKLKKYVQQAKDDNGVDAPTFDNAVSATWGMDAQDNGSAVTITYGQDALYTLIVENTGSTYLSNVLLDEEIKACVSGNPATDTLAQVYDSDAATHAGIMAPNEVWAFQCTLKNIQKTVTSVAKVRATPIYVPTNPSDGNENPVETGQTPPTDIDPAVVTTTNSPAIELKKYVMPAPWATDPANAIVEGSEATYGDDAQDNASALNIVFGESATYRIRVKNTGTTWLDNVVVDDQIAGCALDQDVRVIDTDGTTPNGVMSIGEVWWLECTIAGVQTDIMNLATVKGRPIHTPTDPADTASYEETGQSEVNDNDPANIKTNATSAITLKKYVQAANGAPSIANPFGSTPDATWGVDAQGSASAINITYGDSALYRFRIQNTGGTWLANVDVKDQVTGCDVISKIADPDGDSDLTTPAGVMSPNEIWWMQCTLPTVKASITNIATVTADPVETPADPATPSDQLVKLKGYPVTDNDPASVDTTADPRIELKKYVMPAGAFTGWTGNVNSLGADAQDSQSAQGIDYGTSALYSITVQNTGATWLDTIAVDDLITACNPLTRIFDGIGGDEILAPQEMWVYQCTLANVTDAELANTATVSARPINEDLTPRDQSPVTSSDPAHIKTGSYSIGNMVWIDDGKGNAAFTNDGMRNNGEVVVGNDVVVELKSADLSTVLATTTTSNGFYLFDHLAAGQYQICLAESNFQAGQALAAYLPSTGKDADPETDPTDSDDNGEDDIAGGVCSGVLDLGAGEPTGETPANGGSAGNDGAGTADDQSNLTVDFAVIPSYSLGNQIWVDNGAGILANANNGQLDTGELPVADTVQLELLDANGAVVKTTMPTAGFYQFSNLSPADYKVRIAASNFAQGGALEGYQSCTHGNEADANANGDGNDNGLDVDPTANGITTSTVTLGDGEPTLEAPTQAGSAGNDGSNRPDTYNNLTVDLCVVKLTGIGNRLWIDESDPAARDQSQIDNHIYDANEEPVANTEVQVFPASETNPETATPYASTTTDAQGCYHVNDLPEGEYYAYIPPTEFANGKPLNGYISSTNAGADDGIDENVDENGMDSATAEVDGIRSIPYDLMAGMEVDTETVCGNNSTTLANNSIDDTADFGFIRANPKGVPVIELVKYVQPATGAVAYNAADDATLGTDAQTNNVAVFIPYGESALYRITVANKGTVNLANIAIDDKVSDAVADCDLQRIDPVAADTRVVLAPGERWVYECSLANIQQDIVNTAEVTGTPIEPPVDPTDPAAPIIPTGQSPVRDSDPAHIDTGSYSIGNMVWIDDGKGNSAYANDGKRNNAESVVPDGVTLELQDAVGTTLASTVTTDGYYLFAKLTKGDYKVCVKAENFTGTNLLASYVASTGGDDGQDTDIDNNDNGDNDTATNVCSGIITIDDSELTNETPTDGGSAGEDGKGTADNKSNLTIDFGFVPSYSLGNQIWIDDGAGTLANANNGKLDAGEGPVDNAVVLELLDGNGSPLGITTSPTNGYYLFDGLAPADYQVHIAASNFAQGGVLEGYQSCTHGNESNANYNADGNDNGLDTNPVTAGITTSTVTLGDNEPTLETPTESGVSGNDASNRPDINTNLTVDLCVVKLTGIGNRVWIDESDPAARDATQINNSIFDTNEEPAANINVEVYPEGADPKTSSPYAMTVTDAEGCYHVNNLPEGKYFVHLPATNFANGNLLEGLISSTGAGADDAKDENADENGVDGSTPKTDGINSIVYDLMAGMEVDTETTCGNNPTTLANKSIDDTADFGLIRAEPAKTAAISIKKYVQPATGAPAYDPTDASTHAATIGQDAQTNDAEVAILYRETALYTIVVKNTGSVYLTDVNPDDEIADCDLQRVYPTDTRVVLSPDESWVYQCTLDEIKQDITNIAKVSGLPIEPPVDPTLDPADPKLVLTPTGQTKPSDIDPAVITTTFGPGISIKKYVSDKLLAPTLVEGDVSTYGADAQDDRSAFNITYGKDALYRIRVMNTGTTWLNNVKVDERIEGCVIDQNNRLIDTYDASPDGVMAAGEVWWFECTLEHIIEPVSNIADVKADPVHVPEDPANPPAELEPTGQSPVYDTDPANVTTYIGPSIKIKKYVQPALNAKVFDATDPNTWGDDAQDTASAVNITYTNDALYRVMVHNTGETWLDKVEVDDQIAACDLQPIAGTSNSSDGFMSPNEIWWFECTLANVTDDVTNIATVDAVPTHEDKTTTEHAPINDTDPAFIHTTADPEITIKKYVQDAANAPQWNVNDDLTMGFDAQDAQHAALIAYDGTAKYTIKITNTGATWLDKVAVDDVINDCDLQRTFQSLDADEVLAPQEFWMYECTLANIKDELLMNTATVQARPINADGSSRDQSPVDATDTAYIQTGSHSIGNIVWIDDGKGNASYANDGERNHGEDVVPNGVKMELWNGDASQFITSTVTTDGYYLFHHLPAGQYKVCVAADNFITGILQGYGASTGSTAASNTAQLSLTLAGSATVPAVVTDGSGVASIIVNKTTGDISGSFTVSNLSGAVTAAHIHSGEVGATGPVAISFAQSAGDANTWEIPVGTQLDATQLADLIAGKLYINVHTADNPAGEVRGQLGIIETIDNNDNGDDTIEFGICSETLYLGSDEPLNETSTDGGAAGQDGQGTNDNKSNLTIDFGVIPTYSLGNQIWIDDGAGNLANANNGKFNAGEQPVSDSVVLELLDVNGAVKATTSPNNGFYLFDTLTPDDYKVRIAASNFAVNGVLEGFQSCTHGNEVMPNDNGDGNDNGLDTDPLVDGITTGIISLGDNEPTLEKPTANGIAGSDGSSRPDAYTNLTVDLCVVKLTGIGNRVWIDESNPKLRDTNEVNNATFDEGEVTVADAEVQLFPENADPDFDDYYAVTTTDRNGCYHFNDLPEGKYFVHIPAYQAVVTGDVPAALSAYVSSSGEGADNGVDDTQDENGKDDFNVNSAGISSIVFDLMANQEPANERACGNNRTFLADNSIDDTADFGLVSDLSLGDRIWIDGNANGVQDDEEHPLPGATVELLQNGNVIAQATSNANGNYLFDHLTPGDYKVRVTPPADYYPTLTFSDNPNIDDNTDSDCKAEAGDTVVETGIVTLELGNEPVNDGDFMNPSSNLSIDCGFYRPVAVGNMIWEDLKNVDGILNNYEPGLEDIKVEIVKDDMSQVVDVFGNDVDSVTTLDDGKYIFENLTPDAYIIKVTPPTLGYELTINSGDKPDENPSDVDSNCLVDNMADNSFKTPIFNLFNYAEPESTVDADSTDRDMTVDCGFYRPVAVGNIVWIDENSNGIHEGNEKLLEGVVVTLVDANGDPAEDIFGNKVEPQTTDENGEYMFSDLSSGDYYLRFTPAEGYQPTTGVENPNNDDNTDSNCLAIEGDASGASMSQLITLLWGTEPTDDGDYDPATNQTVGCGYVPNIFNIPTLSEWAYLLLMLMLAGIAWRMKSIKR